MKILIAIGIVLCIFSCEPDDELDPEKVIVIPQLDIPIPEVGIEQKLVSSHWQPMVARASRLIDSANILIDKINAAKKLTSQRFAFAIEGGFVEGSLQAIVGDALYKKQLVLCHEKSPYLVVKWGRGNKFIGRDFRYSPIDKSSEDVVTSLSGSSSTVYELNLSGRPNEAPAEALADRVRGGAYFIERIQYWPGASGDFWMSRVTAWERGPRDVTNFKDPIEVDETAFGQQISDGEGLYFSSSRFGSNDCADQMNQELGNYCWVTKIRDDQELVETYDKTKSYFAESEWPQPKLSKLQLTSELDAVCL